MKLKIRDGNFTALCQTHHVCAVYLHFRRPVTRRLDAIARLQGRIDDGSGQLRSVTTPDVHVAQNDAEAGHPVRLIGRSLEIVGRLLLSVSVRWRSLGQRRRLLLPIGGGCWSELGADYLTEQKKCQQYRENLESNPHVTALQLHVDCHLKVTPKWASGCESRLKTTERDRFRP